VKREEERQDSSALQSFGKRGSYYGDEASIPPTRTSAIPVRKTLPETGEDKINRKITKRLITARKNQR